MNGLIYIGRAVGIRVENSYLGSGIKLKPDIVKYGRENFRRITIDIADTIVQLRLKERFWVAFYDARNPDIGYNVAPGGNGSGSRSDKWKQKMRIIMSGEGSPNFGSKRSEETKRRLSLSHLGKTSGWKGKTPSEEMLKKMRKPRSEEGKRNISTSHKGQIPWNKGKTGVYSEERIMKWSAMRIGIKRGPYKGRNNC